MNVLETKQAIQSALSDLASKPLADAATSLLEMLGYTSQKRMTLKPNTAANFAKSVDGDEADFKTACPARSLLRGCDPG